MSVRLTKGIALFFILTFHFGVVEPDDTSTAVIDVCERILLAHV